MTEHYPKDIILGALIDARQNLERDKSNGILYKSKGQASFIKYGDIKNE